MPPCSAVAAEETWRFSAESGMGTDNKKPPSGLAAERRQIGDWEFATLSFPR